MRRKINYEMELNELLDRKWQTNITRTFHQRKTTSKTLNKKDLEKICDYLESPTKNGLWVLNAKKIDGISGYIKKELEACLKKNEIIEIQSGKRKIKINLKKIDKRELVSNTNRFTFIFNLFTYIFHLEKEDDSFSNYLDIEYSEANLIFNLIDLNKISNKYKEAFKYFKENIYFEGFNPLVMEGKITKIKNGFFLFKEDSIREPETYFSLLSLNRDSLEILKEFYEKIGRINEVTIMPVFSPEEEVFAPYFTLLEQAYSHIIIDNKNIVRHFKNSISEYDDENYSHCISTIGVIAEDYLIQIYETLFREVCPKGLTLGQLYDKIHMRIKKELIVEVPQKEIEITTIYRNIKDMETNGGTKTDDMRILEIIRDLTTHVKESQKNINEKIKNIQNPQKTASVFNNQLKENISELIKNRNAISHKTRIPIGEYEALRTVYCCITLILWWTKERKNIEWTKTQKEILLDVIKRNS